MPSPISGAGGGQARQASSATSVLMAVGIVSLAAGGSWGFYYFMRPPKD